MPIHFAKPKDAGHPLCPGCGYDLYGNVSGRCPECGIDANRIRILRRRELDRPRTRQDHFAFAMARSTPLGYSLIAYGAYRTCTMGYCALSLFRAMFCMSLFLATLLYFLARYNSGRYQPWQVHVAGLIWLLASFDVAF